MTVLLRFLKKVKQNCFVLLLVLILFMNKPLFAQEQKLEEIEFEPEQIAQEDKADRIVQADKPEQITQTDTKKNPGDENTPPPYPQPLGGYTAQAPEGIINKLARAGIIPQVVYATDNFVKLRGVNNHKYVQDIGLTDYSLTLDLDKMHLLPGAQIYILGQDVYGHNLGSNFTGSIQDISSLDAPAGNRLGEFWYDQKLFKAKTALRIGKQDASDEFTILASSSDFINSSFTGPPNIPAPSYPFQSFGIMSTIQPSNLVFAKAGIYDGSDEDEISGLKSFFDNKGGYFTIAQAGLTPIIKNLPGNYSVGYWHHSGNFREVDGTGTAKSNYGVYTMGEQAVYRENKIDAQGLYAQGQFSWAPSDRNRIARYYGASLTYAGLIPKRNFDITGIGAAIANISSQLAAKNEIALECFYKIQITPWLQLQPDIQYVFNPFFSRKNACVIGLRVVVSL